VEDVLGQLRRMSTFELFYWVLLVTWLGSEGAHQRQHLGRALCERGNCSAAPGRPQRVALLRQRGQQLNASRRLRLHSQRRGYCAGLLWGWPRVAPAYRPSLLAQPLLVLPAVQPAAPSLPRAPPVPGTP